MNRETKRKIVGVAVISGVILVGVTTTSIYQMAGSGILEQNSIVKASASTAKASAYTAIKIKDTSGNELTTETLNVGENLQFYVTGSIFNGTQTITNNLSRNEINSLTSSNENVATIKFVAEDKFQLDAVGKGTSTITASYMVGSQEITQSFKVIVSESTTGTIYTVIDIKEYGNGTSLSGTNKEVTLGDDGSFRFYVQGTEPGTGKSGYLKEDEVTVTSSNTDVADVSFIASSGYFIQLNTHKVGDTTITASYLVGSQAITKSFTVSVLPNSTGKYTSISILNYSKDVISNTTQNLKVGNKFYFYAFGSNPGGGISGNLTQSEIETVESSNKNVATISFVNDELMYVDPVGVGTSTITVTYLLGGQAITSSFTVEVSNPTVDTKQVGINNDGGELTGVLGLLISETGNMAIKTINGQIYHIALSGSSSGNTVLPTKDGYKFLGYYTSDGKQIINNEGYLVDTASGKYVYDNNITELTAKWELNKIDVTSIELNQQTMKMKVGEFQTLIASVKPDNATNKDVVWTSGNTNVATVDQSGVVTAVAEGTATIYATADGKLATCEVTVKKAEIAVESIEFENSTAEVMVNKTVTMVPKFTPENATNKNVTYTSSNTAVATVDAKTGTVTGKSEGTSVITATTEDGNKTATYTVSVKNEAVKPSIKNISGRFVKSNKYYVYIKLDNNGSNITKVQVGENDITQNKTEDGDYYFIPSKNGKYTITVTANDGTAITSEYSVSELKETTTYEATKDEKGENIIYITTKTNKEVVKVEVGNNDITNNVTEDGRYYFYPQTNGTYDIVVTYKEDDGTTTTEKVEYKENRISTGSNTNGSNSNSTGTNGSSSNNSKGSGTITSAKSTDTTTALKTIPKTGKTFGALFATIGSAIGAMFAWLRNKKEK